MNHGGCISSSEICLLDQEASVQQSGLHIYVTQSLVVKIPDWLWKLFNTQATFFYQSLVFTVDSRTRIQPWGVSWVCGISQLMSRVDFNFNQVIHLNLSDSQPMDLNPMRMRDFVKRILALSYWERGFSLGLYLILQLLRALKERWASLRCLQVLNTRLLNQ